MKNFWTNLSLQIIAVFSVMFVVSFIPDLFPDVFGDWKCHGGGGYLMGDEPEDHCKYANLTIHDPTWHWGWRHWIWSICGWALFIIQVVRIIIHINKKANEK